MEIAREFRGVMVGQNTRETGFWLGKGPYSEEELVFGLSSDGKCMRHLPPPDLNFLKCPNRSTFVNN